METTLFVDETSIASTSFLNTIFNIKPQLAKSAGIKLMVKLESGAIAKTETGGYAMLNFHGSVYLDEDIINFLILQTRQRSQVVNYNTQFQRGAPEPKNEAPAKDKMMGPISDEKEDAPSPAARIANFKGSAGKPNESVSQNSDEQPVQPPPIAPDAVPTQSLQMKPKKTLAKFNNKAEQDGMRVAQRTFADTSRLNAPADVSNLITEYMTNPAFGAVAQKGKGHKWTIEKYYQLVVCNIY